MHCRVCQKIMDFRLALKYLSHCKINMNNFWLYSQIDKKREYIIKYIHYAIIILLYIESSSRVILCVTKKAQSIFQGVTQISDDSSSMR